MAIKYKKRADGRYLVQIQKGVKPNGKPDYKNIYAYTIAELEQKAAAFRQELERGIVIEDTGLTVAVWAEKWLEFYKVGKEHNTLEVYRNAIRVHIIPAIGHFKLKDLKAHHVQEMINKKAEAGLTRMLAIIKNTLGQMLSQAVKNEFIYKNVMDGVTVPDVQKPQKRSLTDEEQGYIFDADLDLKCRAFVFMLLYTGLRRGEALSLTAKDINLKEKTVVVNKTLIFASNEGRIKPTPKTAAGNRTIPMPALLCEVLKEYIPTVKSIYLFPSAKNTLMSQSAFRCFWGKIFDRLNIAAGGKAKGNLRIIALSEDITPHIFRHTYATSLYYAGVDIKTAQYLLGHSSVQMTLGLYTHLDIRGNTSTRNKLDDYFSRNSNQSIISQRQEYI